MSQTFKMYNDRLKKFSQLILKVSLLRECLCKSSPVDNLFACHQWYKMKCLLHQNLLFMPYCTEWTLYLIWSSTKILLIINRATLYIFPTVIKSTYTKIYFFQPDVWLIGFGVCDLGEPIWCHSSLPVSLIDT